MYSDLSPALPAERLADFEVNSLEIAPDHFQIPNLYRLCLLVFNSAYIHIKISKHRCITSIIIKPRRRRWLSFWSCVVKSRAPASQGSKPKVTVCSDFMPHGMVLPVETAVRELASSSTSNHLTRDRLGPSDWTVGLVPIKRRSGRLWGDVLRSWPSCMMVAAILRASTS
jgi:hypothetical protein